MLITVVLVSQILGSLIGRPQVCTGLEDRPHFCSTSQNPSAEHIQQLLYSGRDNHLRSGEQKMSQYRINDNANCFNTNLFNNVWNSYTIAEDRSQLLTWLSPLELKLRHRDIQERRLDNVGEWLMGTEEFRSWNDWSGEGEDDKAVLFCYGGPGVGKTFIRY